MPQDGRLFPASSANVGTLNEGRGPVPVTVQRAARIREEALNETINRPSRFKTGFEPLTQEEINEDRVTTILRNIFPILGRDFAAPNERKRQEARERRDQQLQEMGLTLTALNTIRAAVDKTPADQKQEVIDTFAEQFEQVLPGIGDLLPQVSALPKAGQLIDLFGDEENARAVIALTDGNVEEILKLAGDSDFVGLMETSTDRRNTPVAAQKLATAVAALEATLTPEQLQGLTITFGQLQRINSKLPDELRLTNSELGTLERNPNLLLDFGITPPEIQLAAEERRATAGAAKEVEGEGETALPANISNSIFRQAVTLAGGFEDEITGQIRGMSPEESKRANDIAAEAERRIKSGEATSVAEAVSQAAAKIGLPEPREPEIQVPEETRNELLAQNVGLSRTMALARDVGAAVELGTGPASNLIALADMVISGAVDLATLGTVDIELAPETQEARQALRLFNQEVKQSIVNNPRFPVAEQQLVERLLPTPEKLKNPQTAVRDYVQLMRFLETKFRANSDLLSGRVPEGFSQGPPSFDTVEGVNDARLEDLQAFVQRSTLEELNELPEDVRGAILLRLRTSDGDR